MKKILILFSVLLYCGILTGQDVIPVDKNLIQPNEQIKRPLGTPDNEVLTAIGFLAAKDATGEYYFSAEDAKYIKFLSTYNLPVERREPVVLTASFILHSLVGPAKDIQTNLAGGFYPLAKMVYPANVDKAKREGGKFVPFQLVPGSETLWWIDIRNFNFTNEAWEVAAGLDGYFVTPIVQEKNNGALRLLAGNAVLRMDWFCTHVTDTMRQRDNDHPFDLYTTFLFAQVVPPKNVDEWRRLFAIDVKRSQDIGNEFGALVTKSEAVSRHNRMLFYYRSELGYLYDTYDVKNQEGLRDYFEAFFKNKFPGGPPDVSDAGEIFATNQLGLQVYALRDGQGNLIQFGDPTVVRHLQDVHGDARVRIAHSCIDCHAAGPLPSENTQTEFIKEGSKLYAKNKNDENRIKRTFLDGRFEQSIEENKLLFARAVEQTNGLTPEENIQFYLQTVKEYCTDVTLERAARECGVTTEVFKEKISKTNFAGRLKLLITTGEGIPIDIWETRGKDGIPGQFQQAMIALYGLTKITDSVEVVDKHVEIKELIDKNIVKEDSWTYIGPQQIVLIPKDTEIIIEKEQPGWIYTTYNGRSGWIQSEKVQRPE